MKHPRSHIQDLNNRTTGDKLEEHEEKFKLDELLSNSADAENRQTPPLESRRIEVSSLSSCQDAQKESIKSGRNSLMGFKGGRSPSSGGKHVLQSSIEPEVLMTKGIQRSDSWDNAERERDIRQGIDLATTLERIEKNFVITDPRLPDNPIVC